jgi:hypothetical protein
VPHHNPETHARYQQRKDELRKGGVHEVHEILAFHGYSGAELPSILKNGLSKTHASEGLLASGIYGSADVRYSFMNYTTNTSLVKGERTGKVLLVRLLLGVTVYNAEPDETLTDRDVKHLRDTLGIHSVCSCTIDKGDTPIYSVYADSHADVLSVVELTLPAAARFTEKKAVDRHTSWFMPRLHRYGIPNQYVSWSLDHSGPLPHVNLTPYSLASIHSSSVSTPSGISISTPAMTPSSSSSSSSSATTSTNSLVATPLFDEDDLQVVMNQAGVTRERAIYAMTITTNVVDATLSLIP